MKKNKIRIILGILAVFMVVMNYTYAVQIFDIKDSSSSYKISEDDSAFDIPFARMIDGKIEVDKSISQEGMFFTLDGIEITQPLKGIQLFYSKDTVRINSDVEYPIVFSTGNAIINGTVEKTALIYSTTAITIEEGANVKGNIICYAPVINVKGNIDGNILGTGETLNINGTVNGKIKMTINEVNTSENAKVNGGFELNTTNSELQIAESVGASKIDVINQINKGKVRMYIENLVTAVLTGLLVFLLIQLFVKKENLAVLSNKLTNAKVILKKGIYSFFAILMILSLGFILLLWFTNLSCVLLVFGIAVVVIFTLLKNVIFATLIVELMEKKYKDAPAKPNRIVTAIVTILILELLDTIPYVGEVIKFITYIIALGIFVTLISKDKNNEVQKQEVIQAK